MAGIQYFFVIEMGEVYIKIKSDNPNESYKKLRLLKYMAILVYSAEFIALILHLLLLFYSSTLESNANLDRFLRILFVISITIVLGLLVP
jgi:hypothetical protein